jgi:hypothetical protein
MNVKSTFPLVAEQASNTIREERTRAGIAHYQTERLCVKGR